uniref:Uncharacterized protein n=1 Tax=Rhizophora mucronata TaxID=61149 RepID=A0A2P2QKC1_RHIMU
MCFSHLSCKPSIAAWSLSPTHFASLCILSLQSL